MTLRELVDSQHFCRGLSPAQCEGLADCVQERHYAPGDYLLRQHAQAGTP